MAWKNVQNITLSANLNETVILPRTTVAIDLQPDGQQNLTTVPIDIWKNGEGVIVTNGDTRYEGEFMYYGYVSGYPGIVYLSLVVGANKENPESKFPVNFMSMSANDIPDEYGAPKEDIHTADMPNIDDYQALKAKKNKTQFESAQEQKLTELLSAKIIKAEDINLIRNAVINTQKFCLSLQYPFSKTYTDIENIGNGEGKVYSDSIDNDDLFGQIASFRSIKAGDNIEVKTDGDNIVINAEIPPPPPSQQQSPDFCSFLIPVTGKSFKTCGTTYIENANPVAGGSYFGFGNFLGRKAVQVGNNSNWVSMMDVFGSGDGAKMINAGRIIKGNKDFVIEIRSGDNSFSGIHICGNHSTDGNKGKVFMYENDRTSHVAAVLAHPECSLDSNGHATVDAEWTTLFAYGNMSGLGTV